MPRKYQLEIWNSTNTQLLAVARGPASLQRTRTLLGEETLTVGLPLDDPAAVALVEGAVLRLVEPVKPSGSLPAVATRSLWRVAQPSRRQDESGARAAVVHAEALWTDLRHGMVLQKLAGGAAFVEFGLLGLTPAQWITDYILPGFDGSGITFSTGTVELVDPVDLDFNRTSPLEALRLLEEKTGGELQFRLNAAGTAYLVDLLVRVGNASGSAELRYRKNLRGVERVVDETQVVTRIYAWGADGLNLGDARWNVDAVAGVAGARVISLHNDALHGEADALVGLWFHVPGKGTYPITAHDHVDAEITVNDSAKPLLVVGDKGWIAEDAIGTRALWIQSPSGAALFGPRVGTLDLPDIPRVENLISNPMLSAWGGAVPTGFAAVGAPTITQSSSSLYAKTGGSAARVQAAAKDQGIRTPSFTIPTGDSDRPYLGIAAGLTVISGRVRLQLRHSNGKVYPLTEQQGSEGVGVYITLAATPVSTQPLPAGTGYLEILAHGAAAEFYLDTVMASPTTGETLGEFYPGDAAHALWADTWAELQRSKNARAEYRVVVADLNAADPTAFPFDRLDLGDTVRVRHPDLGNVDQRIVEISEDLLDASATSVTIAVDARERIWDVWRPSVQRRGGRKSVGRLGAVRPLVLQVGENWVRDTEELFLDVLGNELVATLELRTKTDIVAAWPAAATQTITDRQGTFTALTIPDDSDLHYQITPLDASGVPGEPFEATYRNPRDYDAELAAIEADIATLTGELGDLETYVDGAFADNLINAAEAAAIEANLRQLNAEKADLDARYTAVYNNASLTGTTKTALNTAKANLNSAHTALVNAITTAIADGEATPGEIATVESAFTTYRTRTGEIATAFENAVNAIKNADIAALDAALTQDIDDLTDELAALNAYVDNAFHDQVISEAEATAINANLRQLNAERASIDASYAVVIANPKLIGTPASDLTSAYGAFDAAHDSLVSTITTAIADGAATPVEAAAVDSAFATYQTELGDFSEALQAALDAIRGEEVGDIEEELDVVAPTAGIFKQIPGLTNWQTSFAVHLGGATQGGTLKIWSNKSGYASRDPETDPPDASIAIAAGSGLRVVPSSTHTAMQNVLSRPTETKYVYVEFVTAGGRSSGVRGFVLRQWAESLDDFGKVKKGVQLSEGTYLEDVPGAQTKADLAVDESVDEMELRGVKSDGFDGSVKTTATIAGKNANTLKVDTDRAATGLDLNGKLKTEVLSTALVDGLPADKLRKQASAPSQNLLGPNAGPQAAGGQTYYLPNDNGIAGTLLSKLGLKEGDEISWSGEIWSTLGTSSGMHLRVQFLDAVGAQVGGLVNSSSLANVTTPTRVYFEGRTIPAGAVRMRLYRVVSTPGSGDTVYARNVMLNRGPIALPFEEPPLRPNRETADDVVGGATKTFVAPTHVDVNFRPIKLRDATLGVDLDGETVNEGTDRALDALSPGGVVKGSATLNGRALDLIEKQVGSPSQNLMGPGAEAVLTRASAGVTLKEQISITPLALAAGDKVSFSAEIRATAGGGSGRLYINFRNASSTTIATHTSTASAATGYTRHVIENVEVPAGTDHVRVQFENVTGAVQINARYFMFNRGPIALPFEQPPFRVDRETAANLPAGNLPSAIKRFDGATIESEPGADTKRALAVDEAEDTMETRGLLTDGFGGTVKPTATVNSRPMGALQAIADAPAGGGLLKNGGFETGGFDGWGQATNASIVNAGADAHGGTGYVLQMYTGTGGPDVLSDFMPVRPGSRLVAVGYMRGKVGGLPDYTGLAYFRWYAADGTSVGNSATTSVLAANAGVWNQVRLDVVVPADAELARLDLSTPSSGNGAWWFDNFSVQAFSGDLSEIPGDLAPAVKQGGKLLNKGLQTGFCFGPIPVGGIDLVFDQPFNVAPVVRPEQLGAVQVPAALWGAFDATKRVYQRLVARDIDLDGFRLFAELYQKTTTLTTHGKSVGTFTLNEVSTGASGVKDSGALSTFTPAPPSVAYDGTYTVRFTVRVGSGFDSFKPHIQYWSTIEVAVDTSPDSDGPWTERWSQSYTYSGNMEGMAGSHVYNVNAQISAALATTGAYIRIRVKRAEGTGTDGVGDTYRRVTASSTHSNEFEFTTSAGTEQRVPMFPDATDKAEYSAFEAGTPGA